MAPWSSRPDAKTAVQVAEKLENAEEAEKSNKKHWNKKHARGEKKPISTIQFKPFFLR